MDEPEKIIECELTPEEAAKRASELEKARWRWMQEKELGEGAGAIKCS